MMYIANKLYIKRGIRRIPEEIQSMQILPENFLKNYHELLTACTVAEIKSCSTRLMNTSKAFVSELISRVTGKKEITLESIEGSYEEIVSNWRGKMQYAAQNGDVYLALMSAASCQGFYDEMAAEYDVERINLFEGLHLEDLHQAAKRFDAAMEAYLNLYKRTGMPVRFYSNIETFENMYLSSD
jgi:hypothetical protein